MPKSKSQILLSGIQPSGTLHIGNYLGAILPWVQMQEEYDTFLAIADLHAITVPQNPKELYKNTLDTARLLIACGIDPKKSVVFVQSHVPAHTELGWILNTLTPVGELERMTQYKEKKKRADTFAGLLNYPWLQAADILLYQAAVVPIGEDQLQHLELTRTLARKFNNRFGETFQEPKALIQKEAARIMGLDDPTKKMSKSAASPNNYIALLDSPDEIRRKIKIAVTDSGREIKYDPEKKPAISNLMTIYAAFASVSDPNRVSTERNSVWGETYKNLEKRYAGKGYAEFKKDLADLLIEKLAPIQKRYREFSENEKAIRKILDEGAKKAGRVAEKTLKTVKEKVGFVL